MALSPNGMRSGGVQLARLKHGVPAISWRLGVQFSVVTLVLITAEPTPSALLAGLAISIVGEFFRLWAAGYGYKLGAHSGSGPYRFVRHPYYLGSILVFLGLAVAGRNPYVFALALGGLSLVYRRDMHRDEGQMARHLGPQYAVYRDQVPAFLPQLLAVDIGTPAALASGAPLQKFSFKFAIFTGRHRELDALLLLLIGFGLLTFASYLGDRRLFHVMSAAIVGLYLTLRFLYYTFFKKTGGRS